MTLLLLLGCGLVPDLPDGWEDALRVDDFEQTDCHDSGVVELGAVAEDDAVAVSMDHLGARCAQDLEGWWRDDGGTAASVLVQPVDMVAEVVTKCSCTYDVTFSVPIAAPVSLDVYKRGDRHADDDPQPALLGTVSAE